MSKDPAFLIYSQDFLTGTMIMDFEDRGKYITILLLMHQQGRMTEKTIRFVVGNISDEFRAKFEVDDEGFWYNERLELEIDKRNNFVNSRRENGSKGGRPKKNHKGNHSENENDNEDIIVIDNKIKGYDFLSFWNDYDKKVDKPKCEMKFKKLSIADREAIKEFIPKYKESQPDKQYRKNPITFLNNRSWENEIIQNSYISENNKPKTIQDKYKHLLNGKYDDLPEWE